MEFNNSASFIYNLIAELYRGNMCGIFSDVLLQTPRTFDDIRMHIKTPLGWIAAPGVDLGDITKSAFEDFLIRVDPNYREKLSAGCIVRRSFELGDEIAMRVTVYLVNKGIDYRVAIRIQEKKPRSLKEIGLSDYIQSALLSRTRGLILVSGPTSTGKTTTIASIVNHLNKTRKCHIVTIEDPIEYFHQPDQAIFSCREVGVGLDTISFSEGAKWAMRQVPDVIVIGEILDYETAKVALQAGDSGHLVIASLHSNSAVGALVKLRSYFPPDQWPFVTTALKGMLLGVINQALLPSFDNKNWVLAAEILYNHKSQCDKFLLDGDVSAFSGLSAALENNHSQKELDDISISMSDSIRQLISNKKLASIQEVLKHINLGYEFARKLEIR